MLANEMLSKVWCGLAGIVLLGYKPLADFESGLAKTVKFVDG